MVISIAMLVHQTVSEFVFLANRRIHGGYVELFKLGYPLVNRQKTIENRHALHGKNPLFLWFYGHVQ